MTNELLLTQTGQAFSDDTTVLLINHIKNSWDYAETSTTINTDSVSLAAGIGQIHGYKKTSFPVGQINGVALDVKTSAGNIRVKLYSDVAGVPTALLAESGSIAIPGTGIKRFDFTTPYVNETIADLWFMYEYDNASAEFGGAASGVETYETHTYGAGPSAFAVTGTLSQTTWMTIYYQPIFTVLKSRCIFTNLFDRSDIANVIYLQRVRTAGNEDAIGMSRLRYHDFFAIQILSKGDGSAKTRFLIEQHIEDIINGNPIASRSDGFDEYKISNWQAMNTAVDDDVTQSKVDTQNSQLSRSKAVIEVIYDKYPTSE